MTHQKSLNSFDYAFSAEEELEEVEETHAFRRHLRN